MEKITYTWVLCRWLEITIGRYAWHFAYMYIAIGFIPEKEGQQMNDVEIRSGYLVPKGLEMNPSLILLIFQFEQAFKVS